MIFCAVQAVATPAVDYNRTHASNPLWPGHARFHVVWQIVSQCFLAAFAGWLAWKRGSAGFYSAAVILAIPLAGFLLATFMRRWYGGALHDANGILPLHLAMLGKRMDVDLSLVLVVACLGFLAGLSILYGR